MGTPWRQANWRFLQKQVSRLESEALILDVGAGRGDFSEVYRRHRSIALEVYPYPEIDLVCDLTQANPFRPASFEAILLLNVLEHVFDVQALIHELAQLLKPQGFLIVAIPFMVKMHQIPIDYARYTHYALSRLGEANGLQVETLEGYYDPIFFLGEAIGNLKNAVLPGMPSKKRLPAVALTRGLHVLSNWLQRILGEGKIIDPNRTKSMTPTGYHIVYRKKDSSSP